VNEAVLILPSDRPVIQGAATRQTERRRFSSAAFASGAAHGLLVALLIGLWHPRPQEFTASPIAVTLAPDEEEGASGAAGSGGSTVAGSGRHDADEGPTNELDMRQRQEADAAPPEQRVTSSAAQPDPPQPPEAIEAPPPPTEALEPVPPHKPAPPRPHPPQASAQQQPPIPPMPVAPQQQVAIAPNALETATAQTSDAQAPQGVGGRGRGEEGAGRAAVGDGARDGPGDDYLEQVRRWITRFRIYPEEAVKNREEGIVSIGFKFARDGTILDVWIEQGSGYALLDNAALKMIRAASPIPKVPNKYEGDTLTLVMPERFRIGAFDRLLN
jgi:protein TonB